MPRSTTRKQESNRGQEQETCWDRFMERMMPSHLETDPIIKDPQKQHRVRWSIFALTWVAWILGLCSISGCTFMKIGDDSLDYVKLDAIGLFREPVYDNDHKNLGCIRYESRFSFDRGFKTSRFMAIVTMTLLTIMFILITWANLFVKNRGKRKVFYWTVRFIVFPTLFFNCLMFIFYGRDVCEEPGMRCAPGFSGFVAMINAFVIFTMGILIMLAPCPQNAALARYTEPNEKPEQPRNSSNTIKPNEEWPSDRLLVPELGENDTGVDIKVEKVTGGLKVTQRVTHVDGNKTVTSYVTSYTKKTPSSNYT